MGNNVENAIWLAKRMLVDSIYRSAGIEGLGTSFPDIENIIRGVPTNTTYEESTFVINMKRGWEFLLENISETSNIMFVRSLHEIICKGLTRDAGGLRTGMVRISGCSYVPEVPQTGIVYDDLAAISKVKDGTTRALMMFCYFSRSQLFWDGNKRMAQLMANKALIESGVGILSVPVERNKEFFAKLVKYYESNNASELCMFLSRECIQKV